MGYIPSDMRYQYRRCLVKRGAKVGILGELAVTQVYANFDDKLSTMDSFLLKYNKLDQFSQQLVDEFVEMLIKQQNKRHLPKPKTGKAKLEPAKDHTELAQPPSFDYQAYRKQLLSLPLWSAEEVKAFDENLAIFRNMKLSTW